MQPSYDLLVAQIWQTGIDHPNAIILHSRAAQLIEFLIAITIMDATITQSFKAAITKLNKQLKMPTCIILCAKEVLAARGLINSNTLEKRHFV